MNPAPRDLELVTVPHPVGVVGDLTPLTASARGQSSTNRHILYTHALDADKRRDSTLISSPYKLLFRFLKKRAVDRAVVCTLNALSHRLAVSSIISLFPRLFVTDV